MAGSYMDAPNRRVAWDRDGSIATLITPGGSIATLSATNRRSLNNETPSGLSFTSYNRFAVIFPIPMDATAVFFSASTGSDTWTVETSKDTTNGVDGTWQTQYLTGLNAYKEIKPQYRISSNLYTLQDNSTSSDLRGIRFTVSALKTTHVLDALHIYASPSPSLATKDRLEIWNPVTDTKVLPTHFDWGNVPRGSSADISFRIKNLSTSLNATDIDVYVEALTPGSPAVDSMHLLSDTGGSTFLPGFSIDLLTPGEISDVFVLRRVIPTNAQVSVWSARLAADVNLWEVAP